MSDAPDTKHLAMSAETTRGDRRKPEAPKIQQPKPPSDRGGQAKKVVDDVDAASTSVLAERKLSGIDSERLLVLELDSGGGWGDQAIRQFESKFNATVVEERVVRDGDERTTRLVVQFESLDGLKTFQEEARRYGGLSQAPGKLSESQGRGLFDALRRSRALLPEDRMGPRLKVESWPDRESFGMDVELWHPGSTELAREAMKALRDLCSRLGGRVADDLRTSSLIVCRILGPRALGEALLRADLVARLDLPPVLPPEHAQFFQPMDAPPLSAPPANAVAVCVVDSGVLSSHPLLAGWVLDSQDFGSGEVTPADQQGHGTKVAGLVVHADFAGGVTTGSWQPLVPIYSAKVLKKNGDLAEFPDDKSPIAMVERAIRHFSKEHGCRIFNLSLGSAYDVYEGQRQFAWAAVIDQLVRELDIVVVIAAGNVSLGSIPIPGQGATRESFQAAVRDQMLDRPEQRVCDPATAALAVTVGAIARLGELPILPAGQEDREVAGLTASPANAPSVFSRVGPGYAGAGKPNIKPDFVAWGGNVRVDGRDGNARWREDPVLGELTTSTGDRLITRVRGTSFAAPQVSQAAALGLRSLKRVLGDEPSANAVRALLGVTSIAPLCGYEWLRDPNAKEHTDKLRLAGHGIVETARLVDSIENDLIVVAEDEVELDNWHIYRFPIPAPFIRAKGERGLTVALAFDPPVRVSRRPYLARTMDLEVIKNRTAEQIEKACTQARKAEESPLPDKYYADARPSSTVGSRSTLQVRRLRWSGLFKPQVDGNGDAMFHLFVQCHKRFTTEADNEPQSYGLAVRLWTQDQDVKLRELVKAKLNLRADVRQRARQRRG